MNVSTTSATAVSTPPVYQVPHTPDPDQSFISMMPLLKCVQTLEYTGLYVSAGMSVELGFRNPVPKSSLRTSTLSLLLSSFAGN